MEKICITIEYKNRLERITVDYKEDMDISSIREKPIPEWFEPGKGRDGWEGLVPELQYMVNDNKIEWVFDFKGDDEHRQLFKKCMKEYDPVFPWSADGMTEKEIAERNLEIAEEGELQRDKQKALRHYFIAADEGNDAKMQLFIANLYKDFADGKNVEYPLYDSKPMEKAIKYYEKAAENGNVSAWKILNRMHKEEIEKERKKFKELIEKEREKAKKQVEETVTKKFEQLIQEERKKTERLIQEEKTRTDELIGDAMLLKTYYDDSETTLNLNIKTIVFNAFRRDEKLKKITIPDSVTKIGYAAFFCCSNLESVVISKNVKIIENNAFGSCSSLKEITIPDGVTRIEYWAFGNCTSLTSVTIPDSVTYIDYTAIPV